MTLAHFKLYARLLEGRIVPRERDLCVRSTFVAVVRIEFFKSSVRPVGVIYQDTSTIAGPQVGLLSSLGVAGHLGFLSIF